MKWLFVVLLVANLALAAFVVLRDRLPNPDALVMEQQLNAGQVRIVAPRPNPPPVPLAAAPNAGACLEWGSFATADLVQAQGSLDALSLGERVRVVDVPVATSYWLYIAPLGSKAEMERKARELKALGITDYAPIQEAGRWRYAISLGVFRSEDGATKQLALLRQKGVRSARLGEREQRITQSAFLVRDPTEAQAQELARLKTRYPGSDLRAVDCPP